MKTIGRFTRLSKDFTVRVLTKGTGSNYNTAVHVFLKGDKYPIIGTILKEGTTNDKIMEWAKDAISKEQTREFVDQLMSL